MLTSGTRVGGYEILSSLGAGGMGEVYRARDTKLKRHVALKILPEQFTSDPDRLARFQREAEVLATLNHPHIAHIHGLEDAGSVRALVMELVDGEDLAQRIARGPIPLDEALPIARQIAEALEAAHEQGIIHRDLKPANIKVRGDGTVKVLDFGLAKALDPDAAASAGRSALANSPTITSPLQTMQGMLLGTAAYMSPEQAKGKTVDKRSDIWAFGCVLYEMLTGRRAFNGDDVSDTLANVLKREPDWQRLPAGTPAAVIRLLRRSVKKDPKRRLAAIADAQLELDASADEPAAAPPLGPAIGQVWRERVLWTAAVIAALVVATLIPLEPRPAAAPEMRVDIMAPPSPVTQDPSVAISPDSRHLAFIADDARRAKLWVRSLESGIARPLPGTEGARVPFWSDDSRSIGFFTSAHLKTISIDTNASSTLVAVIGAGGGTWHGNTILYSPNSGNGPLYRIAPDGSGRAPVTGRDDKTPGAHRHPEFLPDGRHFLFYDTATDQMSVGDLAGTLAVPIAPADSGAIYTSGHLLFVRQGTLVAQPFDAERRLLSGTPEVFVDRIAITETSRPAVSASRAGTIAYRTGASVARRQFVWIDRATRASTPIDRSDAVTQNNPNLSPDGSRVAFQRSVDGNADIWLLDLPRAAITRLTTDPAIDALPVWSPDGKRIAFNSSRGRPSTNSAVGIGLSQILIMPADGSAEAQIAVESDGLAWVTDWSPGGLLLYRSLDLRRGTHDIWVAAADKSTPPRPIISGPADERDGQFSPDGRWIAFQSDESGQSEIYIQRFPGPGGKEPISTRGGTQVRWRADGRELFYVTAENEIAAVAIDLSAGDVAPKIGAPQVLFAPPIIPGGVGIPRQQYAVSRDGQRFLVNARESTDEGASAITLLLNWRGGLRR